MGQFSDYGVFANENPIIGPISFGKMAKNRQNGQKSEKISKNPKFSENSGKIQKIWEGEKIFLKNFTKTENRKNRLFDLPQNGV